MIGYLRGNLKFIFDDCCILEVNGVGYRIYIDERTREKIKLNQEAEFFIHTAVREDSITLYGLKNQHDYELFSQLITVSGVGAKTALNVLSKISSKELALAIYQKDLNILTSLPGIGKKSAQRLILELKDKVSSLSTDVDSDLLSAKTSGDNKAIEEASEALSALGYTNSEIAEVFKKAKKKLSTEELVKFALKELNRF